MSALPGVRFKDGTEVAADLVVMAVGIKPNIELGKATGLYCERGIVVSDTMQTITDPKIYAIGECVQHRGTAYGLVAPLFEQAKVAANHLAKYGIARYIGTVTSTKLKVTGIELFSAGDFIGNDKTEDIVFKDAASGTYKKIVLEGNQIKGAVLYGDTVDGSWYFQMMKDGTDVVRLPRQPAVWASTIWAILGITPKPALPACRILPKFAAVTAYAKATS